MSDTVARRREARITEDLKNAERALSDAVLEVGPDRKDARSKAIRNALVATRYALRPSSATLAVVRKSTEVIE